MNFISFVLFAKLAKKSVNQSFGEEKEPKIIKQKFQKVSNSTSRNSNIIISVAFRLLSQLNQQRKLSNRMSRKNPENFVDDELISNDKCVKSLTYF